MAAALSRLGSETVESSISRSSSPFPIESLQDMGDAALMELKEQTRYTVIIIFARQFSAQCQHEYSSYFSKQSDTLSKEIEMFEKFLKRLDPKDMQLKSKHQWRHCVGVTVYAHTVAEDVLFSPNFVSCAGSSFFSDGLENAKKEK